MKKINIFNALLFIQEKHAGYFLENKKTIINYLNIKWEPPLNVSITDYNIPLSLKNDIETLILPINNVECNSGHSYNQ